MCSFLFVYETEGMTVGYEETRRKAFLYLIYCSGTLLDWKGDSVTNHHYGLRLRHGEPMSQRTQWHVTRSYEGSHVMESTT